MVYMGFVLILVGRMIFSSRVGMHSVRSSNHWAWSHGLGLAVAFSWSQEEYRAG